VLRSFGREGLIAQIREHVRLARVFAELVDADPRFECVAPARLSVVNFRFKGSDEENRRIVERANGTGEVFISSTMLNGRVALHLAVGNDRTSEQHVRRAWELITGE
jgi:aromatic-L-amino-acid decarboxylase